MSEIARRIWTEPAVAVGLLASLALLALTLISGDTDTVNWIEVAAPLLAALGIRPLVTPTVKVDEALEVATAPVPEPPPKP
jgi:hypothetical protein